MLVIRRIELPLDGVEALVQQSIAEGYSFLDSLIEDWESVATRYDGPGEVLLGVFLDGNLVAVGGVSVDPYASVPQTGRLRKIFVGAPWRRRGVGEALVKALLAHAGGGFRHACLQAEDAAAARLYEGQGFLPCKADHASHTIPLDRVAQLH